MVIGTIMLKTYSQKIAYSTFIQIIGKVVTTLLSLVLIAYLTRYLGVFGFGEYTTVFVYLSFFGVIADFGFFNILVKEMTRWPENEEKIASNLLTFRALFGLVVYGLAVVISLFIPYSSTIKVGILLIAVASLFLSQNSSLVGIFQARHKMDRSVITDIIGRAIILIISILLIKHQASLPLILGAAVIGNFINLILSWLLVLPIIKIKPAFDFKLWKELFIAAWPLGVAAVFGIVYFKIDSVMLSLYKGSEDVGIYGAPYKILEILIYIPAIFMGNVFPVFSRYFHEKNPRLQGAIQKSFDFLSIAAIGVLAGGMVLSSHIIRFVAGKDFVTTSTMSFLGHQITAPILFQILLVAVSFSFISYLFNPILLAVNKQKALILPAIFATILNIGLNLLLIPKFGYLAAASTTAITELFILVYLYLLAVKFLTFKLEFGNFLKVLPAGLIMAIMLYFLRDLNIILLVVIGAGIYFALLLLFKVISITQIKNLLLGGGK